MHTEIIADKEPVPQDASQLLQGLGIDYPQSCALAFEGTFPRSPMQIPKTDVELKTLYMKGLGEIASDQFHRANTIFQRISQTAQANGSLYGLGLASLGNGIIMMNRGLSSEAQVRFEAANTAFKAEGKLEESADALYWLGKNLARSFPREAMDRFRLAAALYDHLDLEDSATDCFNLLLQLGKKL